jgi:hypothetical protein
MLEQYSDLLPMITSYLPYIVLAIVILFVIINSIVIVGGLQIAVLERRWLGKKIPTLVISKQVTFDFDPCNFEVYTLQISDKRSYLKTKILFLEFLFFFYQSIHQCI